MAEKRGVVQVKRDLFLEEIGLGDNQAGPPGRGAYKPVRARCTRMLTMERA